MRWDEAREGSRGIALLRTLGQILFRAGVVIAGSIIGHGVLEFLHAQGYRPEYRLAEMIGLAHYAYLFPGVLQILSGAGFLAMLILGNRLVRRLFGTAPSPSASNATSEASSKLNEVALWNEADQRTREADANPILEMLIKGLAYTFAGSVIEGGEERRRREASSEYAIAKKLNELSDQGHDLSSYAEKHATDSAIEALRGDGIKTPEMRVAIWEAGISQLLRERLGEKWADYFLTDRKRKRTIGEETALAKSQAELGGKALLLLKWRIALRQERIKEIVSQERQWGILPEVTTAEDETRG